MEKKKGVLPEYEDDIFISYSHVDNDKFAKDDQGWVGYMHARLETRLAQLLGEVPAIWRDPKLCGNDKLTPTLLLKIKNIAILVAVFSPRYIKSEWCLMELREFYRKAAESSTFGELNKAPIFKVMKTPIEEDDYPEELRDLRGYKFYERDPFSGQPHEFKHEIMFPSYQKFIQKVDDLAWEINLFIKSLKTTPSGRLIPPVGKVVYLAETAPDVEEKRDSIERELKARGHRVLPDRDFPRDRSALEAAIREDLERADLSIHLVGERYDDPTGKLPYSVVELQYDLAVERGESDPRFAQVLWLRKGLEAKDESQRRLIERLQHHASRHPTIEVLQDKLEDLKTNILNKLNQMPGFMRMEEPQEKIQLYLVHDAQDYEAALSLRDFLLEQDLEVILPVLTGPADEVLRAHRENLEDCDAVLIFYGQASEIWMHQKLRELRKASGLERKSELLGKSLFITNPLTRQKADFRSGAVSVIKDGDAFPPAELLKFVNELKVRAHNRNLRAKGAGR